MAMKVNDKENNNKALKYFMESSFYVLTLSSVCLKTYRIENGTINTEFRLNKIDE